MSLSGIDVSYWQGAINWGSVYAAGKRFAWCKATEGAGYADPTYAANRRNAKAAGVATGPYHFGQPYASAVQPPAKDGTDEANWFLSHTSDLAAGDLLPVLDIETNNGLSDAQMVAWITAFVTRVHDAVGEWPAIYTSPAFWSASVGNSTALANLGCPLWIAHWGVASPTVPAGNWGGHGWSAWQTTSSGSVPGISGRVDLDTAPSLAPITYTGADMTPLAISSTAAANCSGFKAGTQLYNPDGTPLTTVSNIPNPLPSPYEVMLGTVRSRVVQITTGGKNVMALVHVADVTVTPVPPMDCTKEAAAAAAAQKAADQAAIDAANKAAAAATAAAAAATTAAAAAKQAQQAAEASLAEARAAVKTLSTL